METIENSFAEVPSEKGMEKIIGSFIERSPDGGLYLMDCPTGSGKTYQTSNLIAKILSEDPRRKIVYATTRKENVKKAFKECETAAKKYGIESLFAQKAIHLKSNVDFAIDWIKENGRNGDLPEEVRELESFSDLCMWYESLKSTRGPQRSKMMESFARAEKNFRDDVRDLLSKNKNFSPLEPGTTLAKIRGDKRFSKLLSFYPQMEIEEKTVVFCTVDKFLLPVSSIIVKPYRLWEEKKIKGALIFFDEFDAIKGSILKHRIREAGKSQLVNGFGQIRNVRNYLNAGMPSFLFSDGEGEPGKENNESAHAKLKEKFEIEKNSRLATNFIMSEECRGGSKFFYKGSGKMLSQGNSKTPELAIKWGKDENIIVPAEEGTDSLWSVIGAGQGLVNYIIRGAAMMCGNIIKSERKKGIVPQPLSVIADNVLECLGIQDESSREFFISQIAVDRFENDVKEKPDPYSPSYYERGLSLSYLDTGPERLASTPVNSIRLSLTPERFLYLLCRSAHVVGLSATCTIESRLSNFNLEYLRKKLGSSSFIESNEKEKEEIRKLFFKKFDRTTAEVRLIGAGNPLEDMFPDEVDREKPLSDFNNSLKGSSDHEIRCCYKAIAAIDSFLLNPYSEVLLLLRNKLAGDDEGKPWDVALLRNIFGQAESRYGMPFEFIQMGSQNLSERQKEIRRVRKEGKKAIIVTAYNTVGIGQNLQYSMEDEEDDVDPKLKDIDSIYLEMPTYAVDNLGSISPGYGSDNLDAAIHFIVQIEELAEAGRISNKERDAAIGSVLEKMNGAPITNRLPVSISQNKDVNDAKIAKIVQAIGRLRRTRGDAAEKKGIYVDEEIGKKIDFRSLDLSKYIPILRPFVETCSRIYEGEGWEDDFSQMVSNSNANFKSEVDARLSRNNEYGWNAESMSKWNEFRKSMLLRPFLGFGENPRELGLEYGCFLYSPDSRPIVGYETKTSSQDGRMSIKLNFEGEGSPMSLPGMDRLIEIEPIRRHFIKKGIPTSIPPSQAILLPACLNDFYKGALGEELVSFVFENFFGIPLKEIEDPWKFEKMDFEIPRAPGAYVDAKYWAEKTLRETEVKELSEKVLGKLDAMGGRKAILVNASPYSPNAVPLSLPGESGRILAINSLYKEVKGRLFINTDIVNEILEFLK